jgi:hypothetical protein
MPHRSISTVITVCAAFVTTSVALAETSQSEDLEQVHVQAYSKEFAKRFALSDPTPQMELRGALHALEFSIERLKPSGYYWCVLKAYIDSSLLIDFPVTGRSGARYLVGQREHFMFDNDKENKRWLSLSLDDRRYFSAQDTFGMRAALASADVDWPVRGYWAGLTYDAFYRELFPGITYVKLGTPCGMYAAAKGKSPPQLMLERTGGKDYSRIVKPNPDDFLKLDVPPGFYEATLDAALAANERTRALIERGLKR